jgi:hypothetical protein
MDDMTPHSLTDSEWKEIASIPEIRESWGLEADEGAERLAEQVCAAKFNFVSGSPGYVGDLFILQGDALTGDAPFVLTRNGNGKLKILDVD